MLNLARLLLTIRRFRHTTLASFITIQRPFMIMR